MDVDQLKEEVPAGRVSAEWLGKWCRGRCGIVFGGVVTVVAGEASTGSTELGSFARTQSTAGTPADKFPGGLKATQAQTPTCGQSVHLPQKQRNQRRVVGLPVRMSVRDNRQPAV